MPRVRDGSGRQEEGGLSCKKAAQGILMVLELLSVLTVVVDVGIYTGDKIVWNLYTHTHIHTLILKY